MTFRGRPLLLIALGLWLVVLLAPLRITDSGKLRDFEVFWTAASRAAVAAPLYRADDGHFQFKYLPAFAVVASPASFLTLPLAKGKWLIVSVGLIVALLVLSVYLLPKRQRPSWLIVTATVVTMAKFYGHELTLGQVNLAFAVLVCAGTYLIGAGKPALAAAAIVAAVVVKPYAVLFLPWLALICGWRAAASAIVGMLAVFVAPFGLYGVRGTVDLHLGWWRTVTESTAPNLINPDNVSLAAFAAKWVGVGGMASLVATLTSLALLTIAGMLILRGRGVARREALDAALLLTLIPLVSPQGWDYVFLVATPAIALLANYDGELPGPLRVITWGTLGIIGLSLYDLLGRARYRAFMDWSVITLCFLVVVISLATLRVRRVA